MLEHSQAEDAIEVQSAQRIETGYNGGVGDGPQDLPGFCGELWRRLVTIGCLSAEPRLDSAAQLAIAAAEIQNGPTGLQLGAPEQADCVIEAAVLQIPLEAVALVDRDIGIGYFSDLPQNGNPATLTPFLAPGKPDIEAGRQPDREIGASKTVLSFSARVGYTFRRSGRGKADRLLATVAGSSAEQPCHG
jgi:hypothetical protein